MACRPGQPLPGSVLEAALKIERLLAGAADQDGSTGGDSGRAAGSALPSGTGTTTWVDGDDLGNARGAAVRRASGKKKETRESCIDTYVRCVQEAWGGDWACDECLRYCTTNREWPEQRCSKSMPRRRTKRPWLPPFIMLPKIPEVGGGGIKMPLRSYPWDEEPLLP